MSAGLLDVDALQLALRTLPADGTARQRLLRICLCAVALACAADPASSTTPRDVGRRLRLAPSLVAALLDELLSAGVLERSRQGRVRVASSSPGAAS